MTARVDAVAWPAAALPAALEALARASGLDVLDTPGEREPLRPGVDLVDAIEQEADRVGVTVKPFDVGYSEIDAFLREAAPAVIVVSTPTGPRLLLLLRARRRTVTLLGPDRSAVRVPARAVRSVLLRRYASTARVVAEHMERAAIPPRRRPQVAQTLLDAFISSSDRIDGLWLLEPSCTRTLGQRLRQTGSGRDLVGLLGVRIGINALVIASWWLIGLGALRGRIDLAVLAAWALVLASTVPLRVFDTWFQGRIAISVGRALKRHLLLASFELDPDVVRTKGVGDLFGRVMESEAVETLALDGGFCALVAVVELVSAMIVLGSIAGGWPLTILLAAFVVVVIGMAAIIDRRNHRWADERIGLTQRLVEQMVGYRTRLAQQQPSRWYEGDDDAIHSYLHTSKRLDGATVMLQLLPMLWMLAGLVVVSRGFVAQELSGAALGVSIGGLLLARGAFASLADGLQHLFGARVAYDRIQPLLAAAQRERTRSLGAWATSSSSAGSDMPLLQAKELGYCHPRRTEPTLRGGDLVVARGERILMEGPSGGGKSTLGSILAGLRVPRSGLLLLDGVDRRSLGFDGWRRRVVSCPQYHENHVFNDRLVFNALMGSRWPPRPDDVERAIEMFEELDLGPLLARMPAGMLEMVGEGWQLSHGERTRVYIARTLLQHPELAIFDESFAALDPQTLRTVVRCVQRRARTLVAIAHP